MNTIKNARKSVVGVLGILSLMATIASSAPVSLSQASQTINDISIKITADRDTVMSGQDVSYTVVATNLGPDDATFVDIALKLPDQLKIVSMTCDLGTSPDGTFCEYSSLPAGSRVTSILTATPNTGFPSHSGLVRTSATATFENPGTLDPNLRNNSGSVRTRLVLKPSHP